MEMEVMGNIIKMRLPKKEPILLPNPKLSYQKETESLTYDLRGDRLARVARTITDSSAHNLVLAPGLENMQIQGYVKNMPFQKALQQSYQNLEKISFEKHNYRKDIGFDL